MSVQFVDGEGHLGRRGRTDPSGKCDQEEGPLPTIEGPDQPYGALRGVPLRRPETCEARPGIFECRHSMMRRKALRRWCRSFARLSYVVHGSLAWSQTSWRHSNIEVAGENHRLQCFPMGEETTGGKYEGS